MAESDMSWAPKSLLGGRLPAVAGGRDGLELALIDLFETLLDVSDVDPSDDFFDLGGTSFLALKLVAEVETRFNVSIGIADVLENPEPALLAQRLRSQSHVVWRSLVPIRTGRSGAPLFLVHPLPGTVIRYSSLARRLPDTRVYGLQSVGLDPSSEPHGTITEMAAAYIQEVIRVQPRGPFQLGGYSLGGSIAHEMAAQLLEAGEDVSALFAIDTDPSATMTDSLDYALPILARFGLRLDVDISELTSMPVETRLSYLTEAGIAAGSLPADYDPGRLGRMMDMYRFNAEAVARHRPRRLEMPLVLFASEDGRGNADAWTDYVEAVEEHRLPCDHFMIMEYPHVEEVARVLRLMLAK